MSDGFHPEKSKVNADTLADFIRAPVTGDLLEVPGIGPATVAILKENDITSTFQLFGKYLSFKDEGVEPVEHADRFYLWLKAINTPAGFRAGIVHSVAEKLNVSFPRIYDSSAYDESNWSNFNEYPRGDFDDGLRVSILTKIKI